MTEKPKVVKTPQDVQFKDLSLQGIMQGKPLTLNPLQQIPNTGNPVTVQPKPLDLQVAQSQMVPDASSKLPPSPDVTRFSPANVTQAPLFGGMQTGGHVANPPITQPTPSSPSEIPRVKTVKPAQ